MDEREKNSLIWNLASKNGILLGMFSTLCLALKQVSALIGSETLASGAGIILWTLEFVGCIWLLRRFMKRYVADYPDATNAETYALGKRTCLFSSLILAAALVFMVLYVPDNLFSRSFQDLSETYSAMLDPSVLEGMNLADRESSSSPSSSTAGSMASSSPPSCRGASRRTPGSRRCWTN